MNERDRRRVWVGAVVIASVLLASWHSGVEFGALADSGGWASFGELVSGLLAPDLSDHFVARIGALAVESLLIGVLGTALAVVLAAVLAIAAARMPAITDDPAARPLATWTASAVRATARGVLAFFRSVPEIIWAFLFVRVFGLGPGPAVFAIAITFSGIIGKLFAELIEAADPEPARRMHGSGAGGVAVFVFSVLPLVRRQWVAYALFRLECAIRSASILGIVGAGGLGQEIDLSMRYFQYDKLATALLAVLAYVVVLELASIALRRARPAWPISVFAAGAIAGAAVLDIPWGELFDDASLDQVGAFLTGFSNPTTDWAFIENAFDLVLVTVSMAWVATVLAAVSALALAPMAAITFTIRGYLADAPHGHGWTWWLFLLVLVPARICLQITRALPELVWALLFIVWVGPGITAGVLALAVHTIGILGRLYSDALEEAEPGPPRAIEASGAGPFARYLYGVFPQALPRMLAFTLFRFEVNVRAAAMVGFVGAGGLGDALHTAISLFHMRDLAALLALTLVVVVAVDALGDRIRMRLLRD
ncbi:MAG: ABC transporter permease subunit [Proteobacteria bacterium]|nr:ABC transporter permease subunit [Pseudomonadota bacterium]